ncbi:GNAT family N-acetyltransferase [Arthrobacter zhaoguopingii]|uniref:GNAT family N-acetyltransferase n=1 Tax=Arthrobacter zhaoguopingii TaxID=2681491 RepID=UPI001FE645E0|nr:GNAT family N-acetyltransferase [Arthrobacter zhaoguopingii]
MNELNVFQNIPRSRFEVRAGGHYVGQAAYVDDERDHRIFFHTAVIDEYAGQGIAGTLAEYALSRTVAEARIIVPVCPYIKSYLAGHPEYVPDVLEPTEPLLKFLEGALQSRKRSAAPKGHD